LTKELEAVSPKISEGGVIVFHDVDMFYHDTGMAMSYWNDEPYPEKEILRMSHYGGVGLALLKFLANNGDKYKLAGWTNENMGAAVIQKKTIATVRIVTPASNPPFAKPYGGKVEVGDTVEI
jgi:hypothetical protein